MSAADGTFMSIAEALGSASKSFEEVRMEDYIKSYQTTGRPPAPVPQEPADEPARKALNLPPLFKPYTTSLSGTSTVIPQRITNPALLPPAQEFRLRSADTEKYHDISCMREYEFFSHEELRYYAYMAGNIRPPVPIKMDPFAQQPVKAATVVTATPAEDKLQNICAQPGYEKHSPEEFRIAFLLHGRELTSEGLLRLQNPVASTHLLLPPPATPIAPAVNTISMSPLPQPVFSSPSFSSVAFASTAPTIPKFAFGFK